MTQGEQQHSGIASAVKELRRQPEASNGVESSGTSSSSAASAPLGRDMAQMPQHQSQPTHTEGGDVTTLLHFVNLASDGIKAVLDNSTSKTTSSVLVEHEKHLSQNDQMSPSLKTLSPGINTNSMVDSAFDFRFLGNSVTQSGVDFEESCVGKTCAVAPVCTSDDRDFETNSFEPDMLILDVPLKEHLQMSSIHSDAHLNLERSLFDKRGGHGEGNKPQGLISPFHEDKKDCLRDNPVPLRKRRLPASFWQEPGKSENHRTVWPSSVGSSFPTNMNPTGHNFKMPLLSSPLTLNHSDSRLGNINGTDKGFLYPNSLNANDTCCPPTMGLSFHYASSALPVTPCMDSLQHRSMALSCGSVCSCHLNNNYFYEPHNHGMYPSRSHGEFSSLLNSAAAAAAAAAAASPPSPLSRWHHQHHAQSLHSDSRDLCHHTIPRVLKPIPTKTMSSYPPRFHPIFT